MTVPLTQRQKRLKDIIRDEVEAHGVAPSLAELADRMGMRSKGNICRMVGILEDRGHIRRIPNAARTIEVVDISQQHAVLLSPEIYRLLSAYAGAERISVDTAANALLRSALGADH